MSNETPKVRISINGTAIVLAAVALVAFWAGAVQAAWALVWIYLAALVLVAAVIAWIGMSADGDSGVVALGKEAGLREDVFQRAHLLLVGFIIYP